MKQRNGKSTKKIATGEMYVVAKIPPPLLCTVLSGLAMVVANTDAVWATAAAVTDWF